MSLSKTDLATLKQIRHLLDMTSVNFNEIGPASTGDVTLKRGEVTDFIRERTRLWRESWLTQPLDKLIKKLEAQI